MKFLEYLICFSQFKLLVIVIQFHYLIESDYPIQALLSLAQKILIIVH